MGLIQLLSQMLELKYQLLKFVVVVTIRWRRSFIEATPYIVVENKCRGGEQIKTEGERRVVILASRNRRMYNGYVICCQ